MGQKPEDEAIVQAILTMAKTLGLKVTAEGIETDQQREDLDGLGCDRGQGYFFAKPLTSTGPEQLLEKGGLQSDEAQASQQELAAQLPRAA
jgi:EAL domain-containing protein (putative c-di-GMP-specific phosphodiesterase class I)